MFKGTYVCKETVGQGWNVRPRDTGHGLHHVTPDMTSPVQNGVMSSSVMTVKGTLVRHRSLSTPCDVFQDVLYISAVNWSRKPGYCSSRLNLYDVEGKIRNVRTHVSVVSLQCLTLEEFQTCLVWSFV